MQNKQSLRVPYAQAVYNRAEINAVVKVLENPTKIVAGPLVKEFEKKISSMFSKKYGVMVNSGSSANLIAFDILDLPQNSEVITPILTFSTTLAPIIQHHLTPVFTDVGINNFVMNVSQVEELITKKTRAIMVPLLLGNIPDLKELQLIAKKYSLKIIEDSCDTLGGTIYGKPTGYYSDISTTSFYASHIITAAGSGGMICMNDAILANKARITAYWGRDSTLFGSYEKSEELSKRFKGVLDGDKYDAKFIFSEVGYNFQPTEINGAFGLEQLKKLKEFEKIRNKNFNIFINFFKNYRNFFHLPSQHPNAQINWLAFPLVVMSDAPFTRLEITMYLENKNIQTRPIFTGNVLKQPAFINSIKNKKINASFRNADYIMKNGFLIGSHQGLTEKQIDYLFETLKKFLDKK